MAGLVVDEAAGAAALVGDGDQVAVGIKACALAVGLVLRLNGLQRKWLKRLASAGA